MYAQNNEDDILATFFSNIPNGSFLEIGAFHPKNLSNTRALVEKGWGGVMVDEQGRALMRWSGLRKLLLLAWERYFSTQWMLMEPAPGTTLE